MKAMWNGAVLAESDRTVVVEGNHYFPPEALRAEYFRPSDTHTECGWKGTASYYSVKLPDGEVAKDVIWYYDDPLVAVGDIQGLLCFFNERVDLEVDGEPEGRPETDWKHAVKSEAPAKAGA